MSETYIVNRIEVIDKVGRRYLFTQSGDTQVNIMPQDGGKTIKIFVDGRGITIDHDKLQPDQEVL